MMAAQKHIAIVLLLLSCAAAQKSGAPATVRNVTTSRQGSDLRIEITVSTAVKPSVETAVNPNRILLDFPDTICYNNTKQVGVHANGVRQVRTAQHSTAPYVTRVVLDLDEVRPYVVTAEGNRIILTVAGQEKTASSHGAPVAATSGNLIGVFRHHRDSSAPVIEPSSSSAQSLPAPPPTPVGPGFEPPSENSSASYPPEPPRVAPAETQPATAPAGTPVAQPSFDQTQVAAAKPAPVQTPAIVIPAPTVAPVTPAPVIPKAEEKAPEVAAAPAANTPIATTAPVPAVTQPGPPPVTSTPAAVVATPEVTAPKPEEKTLEVTAAASTPAPVETAPAPSPAASDTTSAIAEAEPAEGAPTAADAAPASTLIARTDDPSLRTVFKVKYVAEGIAYLEGGRAQGLKEGMKLMVEDNKLPAKQGDSVNGSDPRVVAELEVSAVADTSAVTDIHAPKRPVKVGDLAYLSSGDAEALVQQRTLSATRQYPAVISFTEGDTLDEEARQEVPRPPMPSVNRGRGRFGFDSIETFSHGTSSVTSTDLGVVFRGDITRIGGTYWNLSGYWRGRITKESAAAQATLQETLNRTYHLNMTYDNPNSSLVAGFGRLYLPWAPSLDTIDGGYFGARLSKGTVLGIFGGSTPDPSSWDYSPDRVIGGAFVNFEGGDYNAFHYSATSGAGISMVKWVIDRPFVFFEDQLSYKRTFAIYESAQLDSPRGNSITPAPGPGLGRNFFTFRVNPVQRIELDANYNYFRDVPTFDPTLIGTSLLDKYLFQGFSAGARIEILRQVWISTNLGRSSGTGDAKSSLNQMYGLTFGRLPVLRVRADVHYSRFNSSFGDGHYESVALSRQLSDHLRIEALLGQQTFASPITTNNHSRFFTGTFETTLGPHYYLQSNFTTNRGDMDYDQIMFSVGYRFDTRRKSE
jgi:hypothetical protein